MKKKVARVLSLALVVAMLGTTMVGCGKKEDNKKNNSSADTKTENTKTDNTGDTANTDTTDTTDTAKTYDKFITVDVFCAQANYQGIQSGWFAKVVKDKFNMELNIIAPNVAGGGDTLFQTRSAAGNLGDLVMIGTENGRLADTAEAGLLVDLTEMAAKSKYVSQYTGAIDVAKTLSNDGKLYGIPSSVSSQPATNPSEGLDLTFGTYLRWDYYKELGYPEINTLEDILPVLKQMQDAHPTSDSGKQAYGISLFKDWDGNMMCMGKQPATIYGYDELGFVFSKADGSEDQSIIEDDSEYIRVLKWYFDANQMGLVDPESTTQNYDTLYAKYQDGAVLYSPWPWLGQAAYNTVEHKEAGTGFMFIPVKDQTVFSYGCTPNGSAKYVVGIGSKAQDPERMMDFIDWLYSPEGITYSCAQTAGTCGPEGLTWEMVDGQPVLTDFGKEALLNGDGTVPEEWGGGSWKDGASTINFSTVITTDINPESGYAYNYTLWPSVIEMNSTPIDTDWQQQTNALSTVEYVRNNNQILVAPGTDFVAPVETSEVTTLRSQCKAIIVENSWKMVFAKDEAEFYSLLKNMQDTVKGLGYDEVLAHDLECAKQQTALRNAAREQ
ncbi:extracellular solute-binding protein [Anaerosporobacter sp.]|uniref:extracellular solute-binding protein n=1 Tax=Anaerosporobacter sp. TaxID=1872529 RepID=UPI00286F6D0F|nr:extracellular solute-binding protein [Anaerosporobacter sp.]